MYGLPAGFDAEIFLTRSLIQVCFGAHDLILRFDERLSISVEGAIEVVYDGEPSGGANPDLTAASTSLLTLLGESVINARGEDDGTLSLTFDSETRIGIPDWNEHYESYTIRTSSSTYVI